MDFGRAALACYFSFIAVFYAAKLMALRARTGRRHADRGSPGTAQHLGHSVFGVLRLVIWSLCVVRTFEPGLDPWLIPFAALTKPGVVLAGLALLVVSLGLIVYVHTYLGDAWRSGVGPAGPSALITTGPYAVTRHPLFLGIAIGQAGFFLALPSAFSLLCLAVGLAVLWRQAAFEEGQMEARFGDTWRDYARRVPPLLPRRSGA